MRSGRAQSGFRARKRSKKQRVDGFFPQNGFQGQALSIPSDDDLIELIRASALGDRLAFAELYRVTHRKLYAVTLRMLGNPDSAAEAVQDAYLRVWRQAGQYAAARGRPLHWMTAITRNVAIDRLRVLPQPPSEMTDLEECVIPADGQALDIARCLHQLEAHHRKAILLAYYYGCSHGELAQKMHVPLGTVKTWIRRSLIRLKGCLASYE